MLHTVWSKTLRGFRVALLGWSIGLGFLVWVEFNFFSSLSPAAKLQEIQLSQAYRFMGDPIVHNTAPDFVTWNILGLLPALLSIWAILAGSRLIRGDEMNGRLDVQLSVVTRQRLFLQAFAAYVCVLLFIALGIALGTLAGQNNAKVSVNIWQALSTGLNVSLTAFLFGVLALTLSQITRSATTAAGIVGAIMVLAYTLDSIGRTKDNLASIRHFSPFYYFAQNKTLLSSSSTHPEAVVLLLGISIILVVISFTLFLRRDIGEGALSMKITSRHPPSPAVVSSFSLAKVQRDPFLQAITLQSLRRYATAIFWWAVGLGGYALFMVVAAQSSESSLQHFYANSPTLANLFGGHDINTNAGYIQSAVFLYLPVLTVFFALLLADSWVSDLERGRLEVLFSMPLTRPRILLERFLTIFIATLLVPLAICLCILLGTFLVHLSMDNSKVIAATFGIWPLELLTASLVFLLTSRLRNRAIMSLLSLLIAVSFFVNLLNPILKLPQGVLDLSMFYQYGTPLLHNIPWGPYLVTFALAAFFLLLGTLQFMRCDIDRGA